MGKAVYVTETKERKWEWPWRGVRLPVFEQKPENFDEQLEWSKRNRWRFNYSVHKDNLEKAKSIAKQLWNLGPNPDPKIEQEIIEELKKIEAKKYEDKEDVEKWEHMAIQMPGDIGGPNKREIRQILASEAVGRVLETMCGFNSYFEESPRISEVVVLDYCRAMLERYAYPQRKRILYDLERVVEGEKMDFFEDGSFQIIGCWGSNYLSDPVPVFKEFKRILSKDGKLLILESTSEGYQDLIKRHFNPQECSKFMEKAGLSTTIRHLPIKQQTEFGEYYLVEGKK